jgi:hypothetical protein
MDKKSILQSCLVSVIICFLLYKVLCNRTVEVEKFCNQQTIYTSDGKELIKKGPIIE